MSKSKWTWIHALHKELACKIKHDYRFTLTLTELEMLYMAQQGVCAVSGNKFYLPEDAGVLPRGIAWDTYRCKLTHYYQARTPDLVRVEDEGFWMPGNVMFVAHGWKELYLGYGHAPLVVECHQVIDHQLVVPSLNMLTSGLRAPVSAAT